VTFNPRRTTSEYVYVYLATLYDVFATVTLTLIRWP